MLLSETHLTNKSQGENFITARKNKPWGPRLVTSRLSTPTEAAAPFKNPMGSWARNEESQHIS